jgi:hypothetical protein
MKHAKNFVVDFVGFFIIVLGSLFILIAEIVTVTKQTLENLFYDVVRPAIVEVFTDLCLICMIVSQGVCEVISNCFLGLSKFSLWIAQYFHNKSESLITVTWRD